MKVWYCKEHRVTQPPDRTGIPPTWCWLWSLQDQPGLPPCRLIPMRLIPENWPAFLLDVLGEFGDPWTIQEAMEAALDGETP